MKAISIAKPGGFERLSLIDAPDPTPGPGQVRVAVRASGVNFADVVVRLGLSHGRLVPPPSVIFQTFVELARARRLPPADTGGSIATITNYGTFGLTLATPIPLPEQTVLLGMGAGEVVPRWDAEQEKFLPVTEAMFTLSFDHRVLDGGAAGRLLRRVAELLNAPEEL